MADQPPPASDPSASPSASADAADRAAAPAAASIDQAAIDEILKNAALDDPSGDAGSASVGGEGLSGAVMPETSSLDLPSFQQVMRDAQVSSIDLLRDVELNVKIELGRSRMLVEDVLKLGEGSVVELDKLAGDPVDVFVNDRLVARGEVLVLNDNFCVRVNEIVAGVKEEGL
jgi:flagellar motor switch protein FliN/FliY